jgi:hypothetical protein
MKTRTLQISCNQEHHLIKSNLKNFPMYVKSLQRLQERREDRGDLVGLPLRVVTWSYRMSGW